MKIVSALMLSLVTTLALPVAAQFRKADDAIHYRQSVMTMMGHHLYARLGGMANGRVPFDAKAAVENAELVAVLSRLPWIAFGPGTDQGITDAKAAVWSEQAKFKDLADKMQVEVTRLVGAARTGEPDSLKSAYRATANACKACHDVFTTQ